jgi:hypothetical protein
MLLRPLFDNEVSFNGEHECACPLTSHQVSPLSRVQFKHGFRQNGKPGDSGNFSVLLAQ